MAARNGSGGQNWSVLSLNPRAALNRTLCLGGRGDEQLFNYLCIQVRINAFRARLSSCACPPHPPSVRPSVCLSVLAGHRPCLSRPHLRIQAFAGKLSGSMESSPPVKVNYIAAHRAPADKKCRNPLAVERQSIAEIGRENPQSWESSGLNWPPPPPPTSPPPHLLSQNVLLKAFNEK